MTWFNVGAPEQVPEGKVRVVVAGTRRIAICNTGEEMRAIDDICSHDGGPLGEGELVDGEIECPRHGARFDLATGKPLSLPAVRPVKVYATRIHDGHVEVEVT